MADLEERFFAKESHRLQAMESQILQLTQQVAHLAIMVAERPVIHYSTPGTSVVEVVNNTYVPPAPPQEVDPVISRLSQFLDDF